MRTSVFVAAALSVVSSVVAQTALTVNTPTSLVLCQPTAIQYYGGTAPYYVSVLPGGQISATALESFPSSATTTAGSYTWVVNLPVGTSVTIAVRDSTGALNYASQVTIMAGTDSSCLSSGAASGSSTSGGAAAATTTTTSAAATTTTSSAAAATTTTTTSAAAATTTTTAAPTTTTTTSAAAAITSSAAAAATSAAKGAASHGKAINVAALIGAAALALVA